MEILQTLWTALTTENELAIKIISIPMMVIELTVSMLLFSVILNISLNRKQKFIYVLSLSIIGIISLWFIPTPYNTFINLIFCPVLTLLVFKTNILKAILSEFIPYIFFILVGSIILNSYMAILNINDNQILLNTPIHKTIYSILLYLSVFLLYKLISKYKLNINLLNTLKSNLRLFINFFAGILAIGIQSYMITIYINNLPIYLMIINIVTLFIYFCISFYSLIRTNKLEQTAQNLEEEKLYNKTLTILHDNIRGFKHDFNNIVQSIGGYISNEDLDGLKEFYNELLDDCQKVNNLSILNPDIINHPAIYSLLTSKYHSADEFGIKINIEVLINLNTLNIKIYDLSKILGILLDNAIEASKECNEKIVNIIIRDDSKSRRHIVIVENTYLNKDINIDKIFEKGYTSKSDEVGSHGLGLWEIRKILKKNNNLNLYTTKDNKYFKQQLEIYY